MSAGSSQPNPMNDEAQFQLLVQAVTDYAIFMLDPEGRVVSWNPGAARAKGYAAEEILGEHFSRFYTEEDRRDGRPAQALETAAAQGRYEAEGWRVRKDGSRFWANVVIDPIRDETGHLLGFAKITRDITERHALEEAKNRLYYAQKLETVGQLTAGVAHEFNNLLTAILGSLDFITRLTEDSRVNRFADTAQRAAGRGAKLVSQLLAFSRRQTLQPQTSNINELIRMFEELLRQAGKETIRLELDLDPDLWLSDLDRAQFQSALLNLVINARDAMQGGGTLTIETRNIDIDARRAAELSEIAPGAYVMVVVRDTGTGMAAEVKARAIEPFYTTKEVGKASGLGLSQAYGFARQSNGQIEIDTEIGRGTIVRLYLPRSASTAGVDAGRQSRAGPGRVLVVEDDPDVLEVAVETLRSLGYEVHSATSAPEALTLLQCNVPIDVLFTDIVMPRGMNGIELAREARRLRPHIALLLASGYAEEALGLSNEMTFLAKPYRLPELADRLKALVGAAGDHRS
jgi:PAS domain S-box-containing protein